MAALLLGHGRYTLARYMNICLKHSRRVKGYSSCKEDRRRIVRRKLPTVDEYTRRGYILDHERN
jgi:hypothetical protein